MCSLRLSAALSLLFASSAAAQSVTVSGVILDGSTGNALNGATVVLGRSARTLTNQAGLFQFRNVSPGTYDLTVEALGYTRFVRQVSVQADTLLTITLSVQPILLDSLRVNTRWVHVRGEITEAVNGRSVIQADVYATRNRSARTKAAGRFDFKQVPASAPFEVQVRAFGFEAARVLLVPERDTTLRIKLELDTMVQRLIREQSQRLEKRALAAVGRSYSIDRDLLLKYGDDSLQEVLGRIMRFAPYSADVATACFMVDERRTTPDALAVLFPEEVQRVEYLFNGAMVRVYTRRFMGIMTSTEVDLEKPSYARPPAGLLGRNQTHSPSCN